MASERGTFRRTQGMEEMDEDEAEEQSGLDTGTKTF